MPSETPTARIVLPHGRCPATTGDFPADMVRRVLDRQKRERGRSLATADPAPRESMRDVIRPRPLAHPMEAYWTAPSGRGPLATTWEDKPHRLLYDLIAALMEVADGE